MTPPKHPFVVGGLLRRNAGLEALEFGDNRCCCLMYSTDSGLGMWNDVESNPTADHFAQFIA